MNRKFLTIVAILPLIWVSSLTADTTNINPAVKPVLVDHYKRHSTAPINTTNTYAGRHSSNVTGSTVLAEAGPDSEVWRVASAPTSGQPDSKLGRRVVKLTTGMNYWDGNRWTPSEPTFVADDHGFTAAKVQHPVHLAANLNTRASVSISIPTEGRPQGAPMLSTPVAIALYDPATDQSTIIGTIKDVWGSVAETNSIVYEDAFAGITADIVYTIERGSFSQDVILREHLDPAEWGYSTNCHIQIVTEFYQHGEPDRIRRPIRIEQNQHKRQRMANPDFIDNTLGFGELVMGSGKAYTLTPDNRIEGALVGKDFIKIQGRSFLVESIEFTSMQDALLALPRHAAVSNGRLHAKASTKARTTYASIRALDSSLSSHPDTHTIKRMASAKRQGVIIDYSATLGGTVNSAFTFLPQETYVITGILYFNGTVSIEGGTVIKYAHNASISVINPVTCKTTLYNPAILTAVIDDTVGESAGGCDPTDYANANNYTYFANPAIKFNTVSAPSLSNLRFILCNQAVSVVCPATTTTSSSVASASSSASSVSTSATALIASPTPSTTLTISDSQFIRCMQGLTVTISGCSGSGAGSGYCGFLATIKNSLFDYVNYPLTFPSNATQPQTAVLTNCTVNYVSSLALGGGSTGTAVTFVNSILANVTNLQTGSPANITISGSYNGFYSAPTFGGTGTRWVSLTSPFQTGYCGNYYLADGCMFAAKGTANIGTALTTNLQARTTHPPLNIPSSTYFEGSVQLSPQISRYVSGAPDLGYHYPAVDYTVSGVVVDVGASVNVLPGTVIGFRDDTAPNQTMCGFLLRAGSTFTSKGTLNKPIIYAALPLVQELPEGYGVTIAAFEPDFWGTDWDTQPEPVVSYRFCNFNFMCDDNVILGGAGEILEGWLCYAHSMSGCIDLDMKDCNVRGGQIGLGTQLSGEDGWFSGNGYGNLQFQNNLFDYVDFYLNPGFQMDSPNFSAGFYNNLFRNGILCFIAGPNWTVRDNLFENECFDCDSTPFDQDYNAFWPIAGTQQFAFAKARWIFASLTTNLPTAQLPDGTKPGMNNLTPSGLPSYQTSLYGNFYLSATSPLVNAGSRTPADAGLYHYTTRTDQNKEGSLSGPKVAIGLHYVAGNLTTKLPVDTDGDGIPDYVEDANGNGQCEAGVETDSTLAQTTTGVNDSVNTIYDDIDLNGSGLTGAAKKALGFTPFSTSNPLTLTQVITGQEPGTLTFRVPISYDSAAALGQMQLLVDGGEGGDYQQCTKDPTTGQVLLSWNTTFDPDMIHFLQPCLGITPTDTLTGANILGAVTCIPTDNKIRFSSCFTEFDQTDGAVLYATTEPDASYQIDIKQADGTPLTTFTGSADETGLINIPWDLTYTENNTAQSFSGAAFTAEFTVSTSKGSKEAKTQIYKGVLFVPDGDFTACCADVVPGRSGADQANAIAVIDEVTKNTYQHPYTTSFNLTTGDKIRSGYIESTADFVRLTNNLASLSTRNFYYCGDGEEKSGSFIHSIGNGNSMHLDCIRLYWLLRYYSSDLDPYIYYTHRYRFVFLDCCWAGQDYDFANAFGIRKVIPKDTAIKYPHLEQAFLGWPVRVAFGAPGDAISLACGQHVVGFYSLWMQGVPLNQCVQAGQAKDANGGYHPGGDPNVTSVYPFGPTQLNPKVPAIPTYFGYKMITRD